MYIAMNRFKVQNGSETAFEDVWKNRDFSLSEMKGFGNSICCAARSTRPRATRCLPRTRSGQVTRILSPGPNPRISAPPTATPAPRRCTISAIRSSKAFRSSKALETARPEDGSGPHHPDLPSPEHQFLCGLPIQSIAKPNSRRNHLDNVLAPQPLIRPPPIQIRQQARIIGRNALKRLHMLLQEFGMNCLARWRLSARPRWPDIIEDIRSPDDPRGFDTRRQLHGPPAKESGRSLAPCRR